MCCAICTGQASGKEHCNSVTLDLDKNNCVIHSFVNVTYAVLLPVMVILIITVDPVSSAPLATGIETVTPETVTPETATPETEGTSRSLTSCPSGYYLASDDHECAKASKSKTECCP